MKWIANFGGALLAVAVLSMSATAAPSTITSQSFGVMPDGHKVMLYTLTDTHGMRVQIMNYGGTVTSLTAPDRHHHYDDVVLGFDTLKEYYPPQNDFYFGAIIGRYGNRIAKGAFQLDGETYHLPINNGPNSLHGGLVGFDKVFWDATPVREGAKVGLALRHHSKDGDQGFPGNLDVNVVYMLTNDNSLKIQYSATTDKDTVVNFTNHSYFNLNGQGSGNILGHQVRINADRFTPVDKTLIPTGVLQPVAGTPLDFRHWTAIGKRINQKHQQIVFGNGYDHNFVVNGYDGHNLVLAAAAYAPQSGREMRVYTTQPGIQFYAGNFMKKAKGKGGKMYGYRTGFCFETQHFPDSPNHSNFPSTTLKPGQHYEDTTIYRFSAR